ncbi:MAG: response regulator transcription factor [Anaerolineae bacterium]|nr:response regulator transcription factor [Anaerolineae bacterium]
MYQPIRCLLIGIDTCPWPDLRKRLIGTENIVVVGDFSGVTDALALSPHPAPDVILMSVTALHFDIQQLEHVAASFPHSKVLLLSTSLERLWVLRAFNAGVRGYLDWQRTPVDAVIQAIRTLHEGGVTLDPQVAGWLLDEITRP